MIIKLSKAIIVIEEAELWQLLQSDINLLSKVLKRGKSELRREKEMKYRKGVKNNG